MDWARMLAYVTRTVDQELLARNEYPATENHPARPAERPADALGRRASHLGEVGHRLGRKVLAESQPSLGRTRS